MQKVHDINYANYLAYRANMAARGTPPRSLAAAEQPRPTPPA